MFETPFPRTKVISHSLIFSFYSKFDSVQTELQCFTVSTTLAQVDTMLKPKVAKIKVATMKTVTMLQPEIDQIR